MSDLFDAKRWRPGPFLPRNDTRDGALVFVVAVLCFLACLTALGVMAADRASRGWTDQLSGEATVIVRPKAAKAPTAPPPAPPRPWPARRASPRPAPWSARRPKR